MKVKGHRGIKGTFKRVHPPRGPHSLKKKKTVKFRSLLVYKLQDVVCFVYCAICVSLKMIRLCVQCNFFFLEIIKVFLCLLMSWVWKWRHGCGNSLKLIELLNCYSTGWWFTEPPQLTNIVLPCYRKPQSFTSQSVLILNKTKVLRK